MQVAPRLAISVLSVLCLVQWYLLLASSLTKWLPLPLPLQQSTRAGINANNTSLSTSCPTSGANNEEGISDPQHAQTTSSQPTQHTIQRGELPGYTGWARPDRTLAGSFGIQYPSYRPTALVHQNWTCAVHCAHQACRSGGSLFYVRAYGPAILPGIVTDHGNGTYAISFLPFDAGLYTVEVVLAFSQHAPYSDFSVPDAQEVAYEGYLLPGFPISMDVVDKANTDNTSTNHNIHNNNNKLMKLPLCRGSDLVETSLTSAVETGRWSVTDKVLDHLDYSASSSEHTDVTFQKYQAGSNSLGVTLDYQPIACCLVTPAVVDSQDTWQTCLESRQKKASSSLSRTTPRQPHVVFIGDSNFRLQKDVFQKFFGGALPVTYLKTQNGIVGRLPEVKAALIELARDAADKDYYVLFNTGLHDIIRLCTREYPYWKTSSRTKSANAKDNNVAAAEKCGVVYRRALVDFVQTVQAFPNVLAVWQTTTAGWPKWGMYAASWPGDVKQKLPLAPNFCEYFNEIAWDVMQEYNVSVQDAYWLTLSRPDHRDAREQNALGKRLVHAGPQVFSVTMRKWAMMILETTCPDVTY
jgi:hypothetical protein